MKTPPLLRRTLLAAALATTALGAHAQTRSAWCADRCDQLVLDWNLNTLAVIKAANGHADPMAASRVLAMTHLALHDAVNAVQPRYAAYAGAASVQGRRDADAAVAGVVAAHDVLAALFPAQKALLGSMLEASLYDAGHGAAVAAGRSVGAQAAAAVLAARANDGSGAKETYQPGTRPGEYRYTPGFDFIAAPHWRQVKPFALTSAAQFRVAAPPALTSPEYLAALKEVREVGGKDGAKRTPDQTHYAAFWYEFSDIGWNRVARAVARERKQDLWERARTFALLNAAMADAYIAGWDSKMHHNFWRPVTAIREGGEPTWNSMLPTPPIQDHPSTHSALGAAAASVLAHGFGRDAVKFSFASPTAPATQPTRSFTSFSAAARENADSRVRAGLHFRFAIERGLELGHHVGEYTVAHLLRPAP
jgi:hypothetical protein